MNDQNFEYKIKESGITTVDIINKMIEKKVITPDRFPHLFDGDTFLMALDSTKTNKGFKTYCPEPSNRHKEQENGDSFYITEHLVTCFGGCGTLNCLQLVVYFMSGDKSIKAAADFETTKSERLKAKIFIAENFPEVGIDPASLKNPEGYKWDKKQQVLQSTVDYYHFIGKKSAKLKHFFLETRWLKHGKKPYEELLNGAMLGITPKPKYDESSKRKSYNALYLYLTKKGFSNKDILDSGVCIRTESGDIIDFFRNHAIIPYFYKGKAIGLYGRSLDPNCPKSRRHLRLAGTVEIPSSLDDILKSKSFFVCEGEITKLAIKACGHDNVMESRGSNGLKQPHFDLLEKHRKFDPEICETVYTVFDPDEAGRKATQKVGQQMLEKGIKVMVVRIPPIRLKEKVNGEIKETTVYPDVNDLFKYYGEKAPEVFQKYVDKAISFDAFNLLFNLEKEKITGLAEGRMALKRNAKYLNGIPRLERRFIVAEIADYLYPAFKSVGLSMDELMQDLRDLWINAPETTNVPAEQSQFKTQTEAIEQLEEKTPQPIQVEEKCQESFSLKTLEGIVGLEKYKEYKEKLTKENQQRLSEGWMPKSEGFIMTKNEEIYDKYGDSILNLLLITDINKAEQRIRKASESGSIINIIFDHQYFEEEELMPFRKMKNVRVGSSTLIQKEDGGLGVVKPASKKSIA